MYTCVIGSPEQREVKERKSNAKLFFSRAFSYYYLTFFSFVLKKKIFFFVWFAWKFSPLIGSLGIFTALFTCCPHIEYADLAKVRACLEGGQHRFSIIRYDLQSPTIYYIHLLADLTCELNFIVIISWRQFKIKEEKKKKYWKFYYNKVIIIIPLHTS